VQRGIENEYHHSSQVNPDNSDLLLLHQPTFTNTIIIDLHIITNHCTKGLQHQRPFLAPVEAKQGGHTHTQTHVVTHTHT
jgi:hypothetical protein